MAQLKARKMIAHLQLTVVGSDAALFIAQRVLNFIRRFSVFILILGHVPLFNPGGDASPDCVFGEGLGQAGALAALLSPR
jgi:hypothetical protein